MKKEFDFTSYIQLVDFLGACFDEHTEVVLHGFDDVDHSVIAISNGHISGRAVGAPLTGFALSKLKDKGKEGPPFYLNYLGVSKKDISLRCNSFFILDKQGDPRGMICINTDVSKYQDMMEAIKKLAFLPSLETDEKVDDIEFLQVSSKDMINSIISEVTKTTTIEAERLTVDEKIEIVRRINAEKFFLIKGSVSQVAASIKSSEATVYRYLSKLNKEEI